MVSKLRTIGFHHLQIFCSVVRNGGVTAAAESLRLTKSTVSKSLSQLEAHLQVRLLERSSRRLALTHEGERLLPRIESLIAEGERLLDEAHEERARPAGKVRIAATPEFGALLARHFLPQLVRAFPELRIGMHLSYSFEDLQDPQFDIAFRINRVNDERLVAKPLTYFRRVLVASPRYLHDNPVHTPQDLRRCACLLFSASEDTADWTLSNVQGTAETVQVFSQVSLFSFTALKEAAEAGLGIARIPEFAASAAFAAGHLVRVLPEWQVEPSQVFIVYRFGAERVHRIQAVIQAAQAWIAASPDIAGVQGIAE